MMKKPEFKIDRQVFDRAVGIVYYKSEILKADQNKFDVDLISFLDLEHLEKITRTKDRRKETILRQEVGKPVPFFASELSLRGTRSMKIYFNFNRYFISRDNLVHDPTIILHNDNFLPLNARVTTSEYLDVLKKIAPEYTLNYYEKCFQKLWPKDHERILMKDEKPVFVWVTLEVCREMYPLNVKSIKSGLDEQCIQYTEWNTTSNAFYFGDQTKDKDLEEFAVDGAVLRSDPKPWESMNIHWGMKKEYEHSVQCKIYQKAINLVRFEVSLPREEINFGSEHPVEDVQFTLDYYMEECGLILKPMRGEYTQDFIDFCKVIKVKPSDLYTMFKNGKMWESNETNKMNTKRFVTKGILKKIKKGLYRVNPLFLEMMKYIRDPKEFTKSIYIPKYL